MAEILVQFQPKGDDEVLEAIRKVTRHVDSLRKIAKTPIDLQVAKNALRPEDFARLKSTIESAKEATRDFGKEAAKAAKESERLAIAAEKARARATAAAEKAAQRTTAVAERAAQRELALSERLAAKAERDAARKAAAAEKAFARAASAAERAAAREARTSPTMGGITGSMGGGGSGVPLPLGAGGMNTPLDPRQFSPAAVDAVNKALDKTPKKAQAAAQGLGFVGRIIAAMAVRSFIREVYEMTNAWTAFENKIKTVLKSQEDLGFVTKDLIGISQRSRMSLEAVGTIYTRTTRAVQALGKSHYETAKFTETLSKAVAVGGATSIEAKNAMIQLSQGLSSGTLKGDELRSVLEQLPIVAQLIADKMGVTVGQLRKLGSEGKLTTDVVFGAVVDASARIEAQFAKMKPTLESVVQVIKDKFMISIGQSSGAIDMVTKALSYLSDNFDVAFRAATALAGVMVTMAAGKFSYWMISGALANPWLALAAAIVAATVALVAFSDKIDMSNDGILKLDNAAKVWLKTFGQDISDGIKSVEKLISLFTGPITFGWDLDTMMNRLAKMTDMARIILTPGGIVRGLLDPEYGQRTQKNLEKERALALGEKKDADAEHLDEVNRKFTSFRLSATPGDKPEYMTPKGDPKGKEKTGETFESLIEDQLFDEKMSTLSETEAKIKTKVHTMMEKLKPSIKEGLGDISKAIQKIEDDFTVKEFEKLEEWQIHPYAKKRAVREKDEGIQKLKEENALYTEQEKKLEALVRAEVMREKKRGAKEQGKTFEQLLKEATFQENASTLGDIEEKVKQRLHHMLESLKPSIKKAMEGEGGLSAAYKDQAKALEDLITTEIHREEQEKSMIERNKIIAKQTEEGIKKAKELAEERRKMIEATADRQVQRFDDIKGIAGTLSPNFAIQQQVTDLEKFQAFARQNHLADWAELATRRIEELKASMRWENTHFETFAQQMNSIFGPGGTLIKGFADAAANAFIMSQSLGDLRRAIVDVLNSVQKQALSSLIQLPLNLAMGAISNSITGGGGPSTLGGGTGGARQVSAGEAAGWGFASGGYTGGGGINDVAGIVHGQEYVLNADATRRMGRENLDLINKGASLATPAAAAAPGSQVTVHNYAGVQVETQQLSPGQVQVMITKAMRDQTGKIIAGHINDPNSQVSRSLQKNMASERRRI